MICLDNTDLIEGDADNATEVDYTIHGLVGTTFTQIAAGQLANAKATLYTAGTAVSIICITLVNTGAAAQAVNLYIDPDAGGNSRRIIPKDVSLGIGYSLHFDGQRCTVLDASGNIQTLPGLHGVKHKTGGADPFLSDPGAIGGATPAAGAFTTLSASGLITAAGGQIAFPATAAPSGDANTLDDYEEGTFTATMTAATGTITLDGASNLMAYTKMGRVVHVQGKLLVDSVSGPSGALAIADIPIPAGSFGEQADRDTGSLYLYALTGSIVAVQCSIAPSATTVLIREFTGTTEAEMADHIQATTTLILSITYFT